MDLCIIINSELPRKSRQLIQKRKKKKKCYRQVFAPHSMFDFPPTAFSLQVLFKQNKKLMNIDIKKKNKINII